jgi:hypothetical protein
MQEPPCIGHLRDMSLTTIRHANQTYHEPIQEQVNTNYKFQPKRIRIRLRREITCQVSQELFSNSVGLVRLRSILSVMADKVK